MTTATATATPKKQKPRYRLDDALRRYLDGWTIGQEKDLTDGEVRGRWSGCRVPAAIALGYIQIVRTEVAAHASGNGQSFKTTTHIARRTEKQLPARRFLPPRPGSLWPWSVAQHWHVIQRSPCETQRRMFLEMVSENGEDRWDRYREIDDQFPEIRSEGSLKHLRNQFAYMVHQGAYDVCDLRRSWYDSDALSTPPGLARMLATMMVRPVIQCGRITRFEPLDPEEQLDELERFPRKRLDQALVETYENHPPAATRKEE